MTTNEAITHCFAEMKRKDFDDDIEYNTFRQWRHRYKQGQLNEYKQEQILSKLGYKCKLKHIIWCAPE